MMTTSNVRRLHGNARLRSALRAIAVFVCSLLSVGAVRANGHVYTQDHPSVSGKFAAIKGVYGVWCEHNDLTRSLHFDVVILPGTRASTVSTGVKNVIYGNENQPGFSLVSVSIWTYRDPSSRPAFTETMADIVPGPLGFPNYRDEEVATVTVDISAATGC